MTSRLKRKLENSQHDNDHGPNLLENFVTYGTPLPSLADTKKDANEFVPVWQQTVTDEKGRRRFHGAFTGGFSAGYFNTVGSKEGWTPQQFVSSRTNRAQAKSRAEDFMDEEDLESMRSNQKLQVREDFDILGGTQGELAARAKQGPSNDDQASFLANMIQPGKEKIGEKLLRKMGWREGQGVGPRISAKARRRQANELGVRMDPEDGADQDDDEAKKHLFAPLDRPLITYPIKENSQGLGYQPGMTLNQALHKDSYNLKSGHIREGTSSTPVGGAFGIGALEDADEDDYSVYDASSRSRLNRIMDLDDEEDHSFSSSYEIAKKSQTAWKPLKPSSGLILDDKYNDGTPTLPGFLIAKKLIQPDVWFEPPSIPKDFEPNPKRVFDQANRVLQESTNTTAIMFQGPALPPEGKRVDAKGRPQLSADARGAMLGEEQLKAPPKSVFDFISAKNKERIANLASKKTISDPAQPVPPPPKQSVELIVPKIDKAMATAALKGFMPFGDNIEKQARYRYYLEAQAGLKEGTFAPKANADKFEELNKELQDFAMMAKVFKPMSSAMANRFVSGSSASTSIDMKQPQAGLRTVSAEEEPAQASEEPAASKAKEEELSPAVIAVRSGQFGVLTRKTDYFYPVRLLCKRFNVPDPHPDGPVAGDEENKGNEDEKELLNKQAMDSLRQETGYDTSHPYDLSSTAESRSNGGSTATQREPPPKSLAAVGLGDDETQGKDTLTYERPPMDLFKAIFAEDESDDEDEENINPSAAKQPSKSEPVKAADTKPPTANPLEPISFADFKPSFVPKTERVTATAEKPKKKEKKKKAALSFDVEDEEDADLGAPMVKEKRKKSSKDRDGDREKKRKKADTTAEQPIEDHEWVEKEVTPFTSVPVMKSKPARARASDFI